MQVGLIGYGGIGKVHAYAYQSLPFFYAGAQVKLAGVATRTEARLQEAASNFTFGTTDYRELLRRDDIEVIDICLPNHLHAQVALEALQAGKHVYCEKPMGATLAEAQAITEAATKAGTHFQVAYNYRFAPAIMRARQLITAGFLGDILSFRVEYLHAGYLDPQRPSSWRLQKALSGGGALVDLGSHAIDLLLYLSGKAVQKVLSARARTLIPERPNPQGAMIKVDVDDSFLATLELANGAVGTLEVSRIAMGAADSLSIQLRGTQGSLAWNLMEPNWLEIYDGRLSAEPLGGTRGWQRLESIQRYPEAVMPAPRAPLGWLRLHIASQYAFMQRIQGGTDLVPDAASALQVQQVIAACYEKGALG